jgi:hypothetical protein
MPSSSASVVDFIQELMGNGLVMGRYLLVDE